MYDDLIRKYSGLYDVPELWIKAVIQTESSFNPKAFRQEAHDASYGLMQLLTFTAKGLGYTGIAEGLFDPDTNIRLGTKLLGQLRARYGDDIQAVYSAYNSGSPTRYLTSSQVATHVERLLKNLEAAVKSEPLIAGTGALGVLLLFMVLWFWTKNRRT